MNETLFKLPQPYPPRRGHAADPGTGPDGETCGTCDHYTQKRHSRIHLKCWLMKEYWTNGPGSDIRKKDPACTHWIEPKEDQR